MKPGNQDRIRRSPRYPFVDLGKAIDQIRALWAAFGPNDAGIEEVWKSWGYGPNSSGAIQTEAALKQFGLLDVLGRGRQRRLKLSQLGVQIIKSGSNSSQRQNSIETAALMPRIHREIWDRWRANLPPVEVQTYLVQQRRFQEKAAQALVAEYQKTMSLVHALRSGRGSDELRTVPSGDSRFHSDDHNPQPADMPSGRGDFVDLRFEGDQLVLSARVDRQGIPNLIKILRANQALIGRIPRIKNMSKERTRKPK